MELPKRKTKRLQEFDYSTNGVYFVTICTKSKEKILSEIVGRGLAPAEIRLTQIGKVAEKQLLAIEKEIRTHTDFQICDYAKSYSRLDSI